MKNVAAERQVLSGELDGLGAETLFLQQTLDGFIVVARGGQAERRLTWTRRELAALVEERQQIERAAFSSWRIA